MVVALHRGHFLGPLSQLFKGGRVGDGVPGWQGLASVLATLLLLAYTLPISALPVISMWEAHLSSCDPVVSKAKNECLISALTLGAEAFPCPVWCLPTSCQTLNSCTPASSLLCFPLSFLQVARPCTVSSTTETSVFVLCWVWGHKEALGVWGKAVII